MSSTRREVLRRKIFKEICLILGDVEQGTMTSVDKLVHLAHCNRKSKSDTRTDILPVGVTDGVLFYEVIFAISESNCQAN
jgi:hypothetical protein